MKTLNLKIGEELTINELVKEMGVSENFINDDEIRSREQTNIDNYDGEEGYNVYFEIIERKERSFGVWDFVVKIIDIDRL